MMRKFLLAVFFVLLAVPVWADRLQERIVAQLRAQGYTRIEISRTFLGRSRIVAVSENRWREIVINPSTGLILRDYMVQRDEDDDDAGGGLFDTGDEGDDGGDEGDDGGGEEGDDGGDADSDASDGDEGDSDGSAGDEGDSDGSDSGEGDSDGSDGGEGDSDGY